MQWCTTSNNNKLKQPTSLRDLISDLSWEMFKALPLIVRSSLSFSWTSSRQRISTSSSISCSFVDHSFRVQKLVRAHVLPKQGGLNSFGIGFVPGGGTPIYKWRGCSSKFSKETPKSYHIGCGCSQFYSLKLSRKFSFIEITQEYRKYWPKDSEFFYKWTDIDMPRLENGLKVTDLTQSANFFFVTP